MREVWLSKVLLDTELLMVNVMISCIVAEQYL